MAKDGSEFCAVHVKYPDVHPEPLASDEELIDDGISLRECAECKGTGECRECDGEGEVPCECRCGDYHDRECEGCHVKGNKPGVCPECKGVAQQFRKKAEAA
jgi:hypothetical protein